MLLIDLGWTGCSAQGKEQVGTISIVGTDTRRLPVGDGGLNELSSGLWHTRLAPARAASFTPRPQDCQLKAGGRGGRGLNKGALNTRAIRTHIDHMIHFNSTITM